MILDSTSEIDEEFHVVLRDPVTSGISATGAAEINSHMGTATVTVAASNEPHGVFQFLQGSRNVSFQESENMTELSVERLFGNIGKIIMGRNYGYNPYCTLVFAKKPCLTSYTMVYVRNEFR